MLLVFLVVVAFFHLSEYALAYTFTPSEASYSSFLITKPYLLALGAAIVEYLVELRLVPSLKEPRVLQYGGLALVVAGELIRKAGYLTARHNFTHDIKTSKRPGHVLVTHGIYRWVRHPGYCGWFVWSIANQVMLCNPLCTLLFAFLSWRFFNDRIPVEEHYLRTFFGAKYDAYALRTPSGIPFVD